MRRRAAVRVAGALGLAALSPGLSAAEDARGSNAPVLEAVDGAAPVEVRRAGAWAKLGPGEVVEPGESVRTAAASARLVYDDGSAVALSTETEVQLQPDSTRVIALERGTVWGKIAKSATPEAAPSSAPSPTGTVPYRFTLRTRSVVMGVRGTEFLVEAAADGEVVVNTLEGAVDTAPDLPTLLAGKGVPVRKLERIRARAGRPFGRAEGFRNEALVDRLKKDHGGLVRFLGRPVRRPKSVGPRSGGNLRRRATIRGNPDGTPRAGQGAFGTPGSPHR